MKLEDVGVGAAGDFFPGASALQCHYVVLNGLEDCGRGVLFTTFLAMFNIFPSSSGCLKSHHTIILA